MGGLSFSNKYACHVYHTSQQPGDLNAKTKLTFDILTKPNLQLPHHVHISNWSHSLKFQPLNSKHNNRRSTMLHSNFVLLNLQINTRNHHPHDWVLGDRTTDRSSEIITWSWRRSVAWLWMYRSYTFVIKDIIGWLLLNMAGWIWWCACKEVYLAPKFMVRPAPPEPWQVQNLLVGVFPYLLWVLSAESAARSACGR